MPVDESPLTRASLLIQLRDGNNQQAWQEFAQLYSPVIYGFARKRGLQDADAADLMQDVMRSVASAIGRLEYDRHAGTFLQRAPLLDGTTREVRVDLVGTVAAAQDA